MLDRMAMVNSHAMVTDTLRVIELHVLTQKKAGLPSYMFYRPARKRQRFMSLITRSRAKVYRQI